MTQIIYLSDVMAFIAFVFSIMFIYFIFDENYQPYSRLLNVFASTTIISFAYLSMRCCVMPDHFYYIFIPKTLAIILVMILFSKNFQLDISNINHSFYWYGSLLAIFIGIYSVYLIIRCC